MKRLICLLLTLLMLLPLVACAKSDVPSGYQLVSYNSNPFNLYVPGTWKDNASSSVASAYYSGDNRIMVSATSILKDESKTLLEAVNAMEKDYEENLEKYEKVGETVETTLGGNAAYRIEYFAMIPATSEDGALQQMKFCSILAYYEEYLVNLTYCALALHYADRYEDFENIISYFTFKEPTIEPPVSGDDGKEYVLATNEKHVYKFYVPSTWNIPTDMQVPSAYYSSDDGDMSNVSLMEYVSDYEMVTGEQYWESFKKQFTDPVNVISTDKNAKLGKHDAFAVEYKTTTGDKTYHIKQIFLAAPNVIYILTYTSTDEFYERHLADVNKMAELFEFTT